MHLKCLWEPSCSFMYLIVPNAFDVRPMDIEMIESNDPRGIKSKLRLAMVSQAMKWNIRQAVDSRLAEYKIRNMLCKKKHLGTNDRSNR